MRQQYHARRVGNDTLIWDVHRLVQLSKTLPVHDIPLSDIAELDEDWWFQEPADVATPRGVAAHFALVQACDLRHPIILCAEGRLMDGMHRVVKAIGEGNETIRAVRFPATPPHDHMNVSLDQLPH